MSSCAKKDDYNEDFSEGYQKGQKDLFVTMWSALAHDEVLSLGEEWKTDDFSIVFTDNNIIDEMGLPCTEVEYDLTLKNMTIDECYSNQSMFFGLYYIDSNNKWEDAWIGGYYEDMYLLGDIDGKNAKGTINLYEDGYKFEYLAIIIIVGDSIYKAAYDF